ncbi:MAG: hypothetical protein Kow0092_21860 [Deferrisomatales bacterium]
MPFGNTADGGFHRAFAGEAAKWRSGGVSTRRPRWGANCAFWHKPCSVNQQAVPDPRGDEEGRTMILRWLKRAWARRIDRWRREGDRYLRGRKAAAFDRAGRPG